MFAPRVAALVAIACPASAFADDSAAIDARANAVYVEGLGKAGPYGVGYERTIAPGLALGIAASFAVVRDQQLATIAPYLHGELVRGRTHALYADVGLVVVHSHLPSPVPEWDGMSETGAGGQMTVGWEARPSRLLVRTSLGVAMGEGGVAPFLGLAIGARL